MRPSCYKELFSKVQNSQIKKKSTSIMRPLYHYSQMSGHYNEVPTVVLKLFSKSNSFKSGKQKKNSDCISEKNCVCLNNIT